MAIPILMPKQGQSVETCIITKWFKKKGENVAVGDILFSYETDKAAFDLESPAEGILLETFFSDGAEVPVLVNVAVVGKSGEAVDSFNPTRSASDAVTAKGAAETVKSENEAKIVAKEFSEPEGKIRISPRAKCMAKDKGVNYSNLQGSGPNGRIIVSDIEKTISGAAATVRTESLINAKAEFATSSKTVYPAGSDYTEQSLSNVRRLIAKAMHASLQNSAQLTHHMSADVRRLLEARQKIKKDIASGKNQQDITLNDMICWCVIRALEKFPEINSHFMGDSVRTFNKVHLGIAVDTPRGLMVPTIKNADGFHLRQLSVELKSAADACRKGNIDPELIQSTAATFTVSNLGNYGVEMFTPVINLPQAAILGVCTIINRPANLGNNTFAFVPYIGLSLTYDHRAVDGGPATLFLKEIRDQIEAFTY